MTASASFSCPGSRTSGAGSVILRNKEQILIDSNFTRDPQRQARTLPHEAGHAPYLLDVDSSSRQAFLDPTLADEGAATMSNIRDQREIIAGGGPDIGIAGNGTNTAAYNAAYDKFLKDGDAAKARITIGAIYGAGEKTSNTGQSYADYYYGSAYDQAHGH